MRLAGSILLFSLVTLAPVSPAPAQTNEEAFQQFQWQISTPGARGQAMGGAFMALADDASASLGNPAGFVDLRRAQFAVEFRSTTIEVGRLAARDSLFTGAVESSSARMNAVSFVGVAVPLRGGRIAVAFGRHEFLDYKSSFHLAPRVLPGLTGAARAVAPVDSRVDFRAVRYAASISAAVHQTLRLGLTVSLARLNAESLSTRYDVLIGSTPFDLTETPIITNQSRVRDSDTSVGVAVGALYQPARSLSLGLVLSKNPSFRASEDFQLNSGRQDGVNGPLVSQTGFPKSITLKVPDHLSAGAAWRAHPRLLLAFDGTYMKYSDLAKGLTPVIGFDLVTPNDFSISDATEIHLGGELNIASEKNPLVLRAGAFTNHDHSLKYVGNVQPGATITAAQAQRINVFQRSVFNLGKHETEVKGTLGAGFSIGQHGQVDLAYVWKEQVVVSLGIRP